MRSADGRTTDVSAATAKSCRSVVSGVLGLAVRYGAITSYVGQSLDRPVFPDSKGGFRDWSNVGRDLRDVRSGTAYAWVKSHTARRTVATPLDHQGMTARAIADQLGHARPSMTQDVYMGRRVVAGGAAEHLEGLGGGAGEDVG